jgi:hypothetical protein
MLNLTINLEASSNNTTFANLIKKYHFNRNIIYLRNGKRSMFLLYGRRILDISMSPDLSNAIHLLNKIFFKLNICVQIHVADS